MARAAVSTSLNVDSVTVGTGRIDEHGNTNDSGHQLTQELQPLCRQLDREKIDAGHVAARPGEAGDKTKLDRVVADVRRRWGSSWLPPWPRTPQGGLRSRRSPRPVGAPARPPAPAADRIASPPSGIRSPRSRPRHSRCLSGPGGIRADGQRTPSGDVRWSNPITGIAGCCARAASGHAPPRRRAA